MYKRALVLGRDRCWNRRGGGHCWRYRCTALASAHREASGRSGGLSGSSFTTFPGRPKADGGAPRPDAAVAAHEMSIAKPRQTDSARRTVRELAGPGAAGFASACVTLSGAAIKETSPSLRSTAYPAAPPPSRPITPPRWLDVEEEPRLAALLILRGSSRWRKLPKGTTRDARETGCFGYSNNRYLCSLRKCCRRHRIATADRYARSFHDGRDHDNRSAPTPQPSRRRAFRRSKMVVLGRVPLPTSGSPVAVAKSRALRTASSRANVPFAPAQCRAEPTRLERHPTGDGGPAATSGWRGTFVARSPLYTAGELVAVPHDPRSGSGAERTGARWRWLTGTQGEIVLAGSNRG